jgi:hypothetical protein
MVAPKTVAGTSDVVDVIDIGNQFQDNKIVKHFLGTTKLDETFRPTHWMLCVPKGMTLAIKREPFRMVLIFDRCTKLTVTISRVGVGTGLPYGVRNRESQYVESDFFTADFRIDFQFEFRRIGRILSVLPRMDAYGNWADRILRDLVTSFALQD